LFRYTLFSYINNHKIIYHFGSQHHGKLGNMTILISKKVKIFRSHGN